MSIITGLKSENFTMEFKPAAIILRERAPNNKGEAMGWVIILAGPSREREVLAVIAYETGLDCARAFAQIIASKYKVKVTDELQFESDVTANQVADYTYYPHT